MEIFQTQSPSYIEDSGIWHLLPSNFGYQVFPSKILEDTCKQNALSSKVLVVKSEIFLQKINVSSTGDDGASRFQKFNYKISTIVKK